MSEDFKDIEVNKRKWRVLKFDAEIGALVIKKLSPIIASFLGEGIPASFLGEGIPKIEAPSEVKLDMGLVGSAIKVLNAMPDEDFLYIRKVCLKTTMEHLGAGLIPVISDNGTYGVIGIERDTMTALALTAHCLMFNVTGFFQDTPLASMLGDMLSTLSPNLQT